MPEIEELTPGEAMAIAHRSVTDITGSGEPIEPLAALSKYNMKNEDSPSVRQNILNSKVFGLPHYKHKMNPNAIKDLSPGWTLQELADIIFDNAEPVTEPARPSLA